MSGSPARLAILIPCYNEEATISATIRDFRAVFPEASVVVCDNASRDKTAAIARQEGAALLSEPRRGKGFAVRRLFSDVIADRYVLTDGDHTYRAEDAATLLRAISEGHADMVVGERFSSGTYGQATRRAFHHAGNRLIARLVSLFFNVRIRDPLSGLRAMSARFVRTIPLISTGFEVETELTMQAIDKGFVLEETAIPYYARPEESPSKLRTASDGVRIVLTFFRFLLYFRPLTLSISVSLLSLLLALLLGISPVLEYLEHRYVYKVPSLIVSVAFLLIALVTFFLGFVFESLRYSRMENFLLLKSTIR